MQQNHVVAGAHIPGAFRRDFAAVVEAYRRLAVDRRDRAPTRLFSAAGGAGRAGQSTIIAIPVAIAAGMSRATMTRRDAPGS
ncbi:hypothetical protein [Actinoplanes sp. NPDC048796]|uniref:hypothetical protein n=1 Tax=Actinoplanes sp. NPDC048796 TaxID=3155640 RepID=UPI0033C285DC